MLLLLPFKPCRFEWGPSCCCDDSKPSARLLLPLNLPCSQGTFSFTLKTSDPTDTAAEG